MHILTLTAISDRDPSCNLYTVEQSYEYRGHPSHDEIRKHAEAMIAFFTASWPYRRYAVPRPFLDVTLHEVPERDSDVWREAFPADNSPYKQLPESNT